MLLRVSSEIEGAAADVKAVTESGAESGVPHGGPLTTFAEAAVLGGADLEGVFVDWPDFVRIVGDGLVAAEGLVPMRFAFDGPCSDDLWQQLLAVGKAMGHVEPTWQQ